MGTEIDARPFGDDGGFGPLHIIEPSSDHTHTAIMLHGRGSNGPEFAEELSETVLPGQKPLVQRFPGWRWVFLSSQELWSTAFEESLSAWFEAHSLTDTSERQDLQTAGIGQSVSYIQTIVDREIARLGGAAERLVIAGISQGGAIGMWTLLCQRDVSRRLGAFVGVSTWLPFAGAIERLLGGGDGSGADTFVESMMRAWRRQPCSQSSDTPLLSTPVFLGLGVDDAVVDIELGREARRVLAQVGFRVEWKEYSGAELDGHWLKVPEEVDDIAAFLMRVISS